MRCVNENRKKRKRLRVLAVFIYATHATQAIAFEWKRSLKHAVDNNPAVSTWLYGTPE